MYVTIHIFQKRPQVRRVKEERLVSFLYIPAGQMADRDGGLAVERNRSAVPKTADQQSSLGYLWRKVVDDHGQWWSNKYPGQPMKNFHRGLGQDTCLFSIFFSFFYSHIPWMAGSQRWGRQRPRMLSRVLGLLAVKDCGNFLKQGSGAAWRHHGTGIL